MASWGGGIFHGSGFGAVHLGRVQTIRLALSSQLLITVQMLTRVILAMVTLIGCGLGPEPTPYEYVLSRVPSDLQHFFPTSIAAPSATVTFNEEPFSDQFQQRTTFYYIALVPLQFDSLAHAIRESSIATYRPNEDCNVVVNRFQKDGGFTSSHGQEWLYNSWVGSLDTCASRYPIPNFAGLEEPEFIAGKGLSEDFEIHVQRSANSMDLSGRYYGPQVIMPEHWQRGHSRGACVNRKTRKIIWWLVIW